VVAKVRADSSLVKPRPLLVVFDVVVAFFIFTLITNAFVIEIRGRLK